MFKVHLTRPHCRQRQHQWNGLLWEDSFGKAALVAREGTHACLRPMPTSSLKCANRPQPTSAGWICFHPLIVNVLHHALIL